MKLRILIFSILTIFLLNTVGYAPIFKIKQWMLHHKMEKMMACTFINDSLSCISMPSDRQGNLLWEQQDKEFWYKGQLYDIVRQEKKEGITYYYCVEDTSETELSLQFAENIKKQTENDNDESTPLSNIFKKATELDLPPVYRNTMPIFLVYTDSKRSDVIPFLEHYQSRFYNHIDPPPKGLI